MGGSGFRIPPEKEVAMQLVSSAENSSLRWRAQYRYIEDIRDGRGFTGGIIGFTSGTGDMHPVLRLGAERSLVQIQSPRFRRNPLSRRALGPEWAGRGPDDRR